MSLEPDSVSVLTLEVDLRNAPDPEIAPLKIWFVEDAWVSVVDVPSEIAPAYEPESSDPLPDTVIAPADNVVEPS